MPAALREHPDGARLLQAICEPRLQAKEADVIATVTLTGVTPTLLRSLIEAAFVD